MTNTVSQIPSSPPKAPQTRRRVVIVVAALLLAAVLGVGAALYGPALLGFEKPAQDAGTSAAQPEAAQPSGEFTEFIHEPTGIALSYPSTWFRQDIKGDNPQGLLIVSDKPKEDLLSAGTTNILLLSAAELRSPVGEQELDAAKAELDQHVGAEESARLLVAPQKLTVGGMPGWWYFYSFKDEVTGQTGAHSHFFLFKGTTLFSLVYQTVPLEKFQESAPVFDGINGSLHTLEK